MKLHLPRGLRTALLACLNVTFASLAALGGMAFAAAPTPKTLDATTAYYYKGSGNWDLTSNDWATTATGSPTTAFANGQDAYFAELAGGNVAVKDDVEVANLYVTQSAYVFSQSGGSLSLLSSANVAAGATATFNLDLTIHDEFAFVGPGTFILQAIHLDVTATKPELQPVVRGGALLDTPHVDGTGVLHVKGSTLRASQDTEISNMEMEIDERTRQGALLLVNPGVNLTISDALALQDTTVSNYGKISVAKALVIKDSVELGTIESRGIMQVDSPAPITISMTEGSIQNLILPDKGSVVCERDLSLGNTSSNGKVQVGGNFTVTGSAKLGTVTAGSLTLAGEDLGSGFIVPAELNVTGQLSASSITLQHLSKDSTYLSAGSLGAGSTSFVVAPEVLNGLDVKDGDQVVLAALNNTFADAASLTINDKDFWLNDKKGLLMYIGQDEASKDIVLNVTLGEYIWTNEDGDTLWNTGGNWMGYNVPDADAYALVLAGEKPWTITMDADGEAKNLSFCEGSTTTLVGEYNLTVHDTLSVESDAAVTVTEDVDVNAKNIFVNGRLAAKDDVDVTATTILVNGELSVADSVTVSAETLVLNGELALQQDPYSVEAGATVMRLNGAAGAKLTGPNPLVITGQGGVYAGGYDSAIVHLKDGAQASLAAGDGLSLIADSGSRATLTYIGATSVDTIQGDGMNLVLNGQVVDNNKNPLTISASSGAYLTNSIIVSGLSAKDTALTLGTGHAVVVDANSLSLDGSVLKVYQTETDVHAMKLGDVSQREGVKLFRFGGDDSNVDEVQLYGNLFDKYYQNARMENGWVLVDLKDIHFSGITSAHTYNGISGAAMLNDAYDQLDPQALNPEGDLATVMDALEAEQVPVADQDRLAAAMAGASFAAMGAAFSKDVERQLRSIRNRTTSMGCDECVVNEDMPYVNCWVNAEGEFRRLKAENTLAGYKLNSWGGTVGVDVDFTNRFTAGVAFTYMNGDFTSCSADQASGDLDRYYVSLFARYNHRAWTHTLVGTFGWADTSLDRTVNYAGGSYRTTGGSNGSAFGLLYEVGYTWALNESATTCLQPIANVMFRHSNLGGYNESGSDAALSYGDSDSDVVTFGLGTRLQRAAGSTFYNRTTLWEGRLLFKADAGERSSYSNAHFLGVQGSRSIKSARYGACGLEIGAGVIIPVGSDADSLFFDVSAEFRGSYSEVNGVFGYRVNF